jgi:hypothetical protein
MEILKNQYVLDVGGGPDWLPTHGHGQWVLDSMRNLRTAQLAWENPHTTYIVIDQHIPKPEASSIHELLPNLHFVEARIAQPTCLPFTDASVDRVEINHMWTPLTATPSVPSNLEPKGISGGTDYFYTLREACRVLKSKGVLSLTEKQDRLKKIRYLLSRDSYLNLDGVLLFNLGLDLHEETQVLTKITNPNRSEYTHRAFTQEVDVYSLELRKI